MLRARWILYIHLWQFTISTYIFYHYSAARVGPILGAVFSILLLLGIVISVVAFWCSKRAKALESKERLAARMSGMCEESEVTVRVLERYGSDVMLGMQGHIWGQMSRLHNTLQSAHMGRYRNSSGILFCWKSCCNCNGPWIKRFRKNTELMNSIANSHLLGKRFKKWFRSRKIIVFYYTVFFAALNTD